MARKGKVQQKILLLLLAGLSLSLSRSPRHHLRVIREAKREWDNIDRKALKQAIASLYKSKLIDQKINKDKTTTFVLSVEGKRLALTYNLENMVIKSHPWDNKWRIVIFDVPERLKKVREALRLHLKRLGFKELQRSVFVLPFECKNEIEYLIEFYNIRRFVRYIEAGHIDNELHLKHIFRIS